eukprot:1143443-Pelagomonas_calceolata.AAC.1
MNGKGVSPGLFDGIYFWKERKEKERKVYAGHRPRAFKKGPLTSKLARTPPVSGNFFLLRASLAVPSPNRNFHSCSVITEAQNVDLCIKILAQRVFQGAQTVSQRGGKQVRTIASGWVPPVVQMQLWLQIHMVDIGTGWVCATGYVPLEGR